MSEPFSKLSETAWRLTKDGYTVTVEATLSAGPPLRVYVTNPAGEEVDDATFGHAAWREARWMLDSAIEAGE
jgi:hypothetical protein